MCLEDYENARLGYYTVSLAGNINIGSVRTLDDHDLALDHSDCNTALLHRDYAAVRKVVGKRLERRAR